MFTQSIKLKNVTWMTQRKWKYFGQNVGTQFPSFHGLFILTGKQYGMWVMSNSRKLTVILLIISNETDYELDCMT
jgi:hypothetical protein